MAQSITPRAAIALAIKHNISFPLFSMKAFSRSTLERLCRDSSGAINPSVRWRNDVNATQLAYLSPIKRKRRTEKTTVPGPSDWWLNYFTHFFSAVKLLLPWKQRIAIRPTRRRAVREGRQFRGACFLFGAAFSVKSSRLNRDQSIHTKTVRREKIASIYGTLRYYCTFGVYAPLDVCYALLFQHDFFFFFLRLFLSFNNEECFSSWWTLKYFFSCLRLKWSEKLLFVECTTVEVLLIKLSFWTAWKRRSFPTDKSTQMEIERCFS